VSPWVPMSSRRGKCGQVGSASPRRGRLACRPQGTVNAENTQFSATIGGLHGFPAGWEAVQRCFFGVCYRNPFLKPDGTPVSPGQVRGQIEWLVENVARVDPDRHPLEVPKPRLLERVVFDSRLHSPI